MKSIAVQSDKGGAGKTTVTLLLAKYAAGLGREVCVLDCDFTGSGMADLIALQRPPEQYLEHYFLDEEPHEFAIGKLLGEYTDKELRPGRFRLALNLWKGALNREESRKIKRMEDDMATLLADEPNYRQIQARIPVLFELLASQGIDLVLVDCHPGLGLMSQTVQPLVDLNVYVTTTNRSDCSGLLKKMNLRHLDGARSFLILNMAEAPLPDISGFRLLVERDPLLRRYSKWLFSQLKFVGNRDEHFAAVSLSMEIRRPFTIGGPGYLPAIDLKNSNFDFCRKVLALI